jgi:hypothetical protein
VRESHYSKGFRLSFQSINKMANLLKRHPQRCLIDQDKTLKNLSLQIGTTYLAIPSSKLTLSKVMKALNHSIGLKEETMHIIDRVIDHPSKDPWQPCPHINQQICSTLDKDLNLNLRDKIMNELMNLIINC